MPRDSRMSRLLHVLIHMDRHLERPTSEQISVILGTNPVVVRRMLSGLRDCGLIASAKGHGGGWQLTRSLAEITLLDVYLALGEPSLFNIGPNSEHPDCLVEQAVDARMAQTMGEAENLIRDRFSAITIADLADDFDCRMEQQKPPAAPHGNGA